MGAAARHRGQLARRPTGVVAPAPAVRGGNRRARRRCCRGGRQEPCRDGAATDAGRIKAEAALAQGGVDSDTRSWPGPALQDRRPDGRLCASLGHFRSEEHTSELQSLMRISYAVFCLKKKNKNYE